MIKLTAGIMFLTESSRADYSPLSYFAPRATLGVLSHGNPKESRWSIGNAMFIGMDAGISKEISEFQPETGGRHVNFC